MHFTEHTGFIGPRSLLRWLGRGKAALVAALLAGCSSPMPPYRPAPPAPAPAAPEPPRAAVNPREPSPTPAPTADAGRQALKPPAVVSSWSEYRRQAAERLVAAHPETTFLGPVPDVLLAIPVLEVELNADGSVRKVQVLRHPRQATDTTQLAIDAVYRAAPYGSVSRLPKPWKFSETFLFNDARRFKPRTLDD